MVNVKTEVEDPLASAFASENEEEKAEANLIDDADPAEVSRLKYQREAAERANALATGMGKDGKPLKDWEITALTQV